jgi:hypothetical protein
MQQTKLIKNITDVSKYSSDSNILLKPFENIIRLFRLSQVNKRLNKAKTRGVESENIFKILFFLYSSLTLKILFS